jgi:hypothetical protein
MDCRSRGPTGSSEGSGGRLDAVRRSRPPVLKQALLPETPRKVPPQREAGFSAVVPQPRRGPAGTFRDAAKCSAAAWGEDCGLAGRRSARPIPQSQAAASDIPN